MTAEYKPTSRPPVSDALVSVVLPVYNELPVLAELCQRLRMTLTACRTTFEIIFVNDGSRDGGAALLDRLAREFEEVRVLHLSRNFGQQAAIHAGLQRARGDAVVIMDANLSDPPEAIGQMLACWQDGYDVVYAQRVRGDRSWWKQALAAIGHRLTSDAGLGVPQYAGNFGLIDARLAQQIAALKEQDRYLPALRHWMGFKQIGVIVHRVRRHNQGSKRWVRGIARFANAAIYSAAPPAMFTWLGWIALAVFIYLSGFAAYCKVFTAAAVPGWALQVILISFFAGLNALGIGLLGHYLLRMYDQVRGRPLYLVDRTVNCAATEIREAEIAAAAQFNGTPPAPPNALNLEQLDPLEIEDDWDDAYQHLLDHAQGLLELGALARSEADDLADRECCASAGLEEVPEQAADNGPGTTIGGPNNPPQPDEPSVIKFSESPRW